VEGVEGAVLVTRGLGVLDDVGFVLDGFELDRFVLGGVVGTTTLGADTVAPRVNGEKLLLVVIV
jgi:hypothetical protein